MKTTQPGVSTMEGEVLASTASGLRILAFCDYVSDDSYGGVERVALEMYERLARMGCRISILTALPRSMKPLTRIEGVSVHVVPLLDLSRLTGAQVGFAPRLLREASRVTREFRPNVLYAHGIHFQTTIAAALVQKSKGLPLVTVSHLGGLENLREPVRSLTTLYERTVGRYILSRSTRVIAVSSSVEQHLLALGVKPENIDVVSNGVDLEKFKPRPEDSPIQSTPLIMFVGRLIANKGPQILLDALTLLQKQGMLFEAVFVGDGPLRAPLEKRAKERNLDSNVRFVGFDADVATRLRQADVVVRPSLTEGLPLGVLEAMASRVCVLASDIPGNRDLIRDRENGMLVAAGNALQLAIALRQLLDDRALRIRLANAGYETAQAYSWDAGAGVTARVLSRARTGVAASSNTELSRGAR